MTERMTDAGLKQLLQDVRELSVYGTDLNDTTLATLDTVKTALRAFQTTRAENIALRDALHVFLDAHAEQGPMTQLSDYLVDKAKRALTDQEPDGCYDPHGMEE
jgi:glutamine synthetase adenylyltransferase